MAPARGLVFLDASVLVAAAHSPTGGSAAALLVCGGPRFRGAVTMRVLEEARLNVAEKFPGGDLARFYQQLAALEPEIVPPPPAELLAECVPLTTEKDAHVLAGALGCRAAYLLTLDRRHLLTRAVGEAALSTRVLTPGTFLQELLA